MSDFIKGLKTVSPILVGIIPFGIICGITSVNAGLTESQSILMSFIIFAGSAQMALANLVYTNSPMITVIATVALINLRMAMYSASISKHLETKSLIKRMFSAYLLTDQAYAISISEFSLNKKINKVNFYLGVAFTIWFVWQISLVSGVLLGKTIPSSWSLEFAIPLTFLAVTVPFLKDKFFVITAITTGILMIITRNLPYNTGFFISVFSGIFTGIYFKRKTK